MLKKHEQACFRHLGAIDVTEIRIDHLPDTKPFNSPPFRARPKTSELERAEIDKQLKVGVI